MTRVLITGAAGYIGARLVERLGADASMRVTATDVRQPAGALPENARYVACDVRSAEMSALIAAERPDVIVHLAAIVTPGKDSRRDFEYSVDVGGTRNVLDAAISAGVGRLVVTSSGAAYGYHADHPEWLTENDPLRGNEEFAYSWHKRLIESMLADARRHSPSLEQVVFRVSTVLGRTTRNQITALFDKPVLISVRGGDDRFVLVWDEDVARALEYAIASPATGVFNLASDGAVTMREMARLMGKPYLRVPAGVLRGLFGVLKPLGLSQYGPEQVNFLQYRPVMSNAALRDEFGFVPEKSSAEVFEFFLRARA